MMILGTDTADIGSFYLAQRQICYLRKLRPIKQLFVIHSIAYYFICTILIYYLRSSQVIYGGTVFSGGKF